MERKFSKRPRYDESVGGQQPDQGASAPASQKPEASVATSQKRARRTELYPGLIPIADEGASAQGTTKKRGAGEMGENGQQPVLPAKKARSSNGQQPVSAEEAGQNLGEQPVIQTPSQLLNKYNHTSMRLIPLDRLAVHPLNRKGKALNGANVMNLMKRWHNGSKNGGEDFQEYRYKPARCVEPNPMDLHGPLVHTNKMALRDGRIRPVADATGTGLFAMYSKSHMWSALWGTVGRSMRVDLHPDKALLIPPTDQPDFTFAEKHGIWCEVLNFRAPIDHPEVFLELMQSENYDASSSLPEDEMQFLVDMSQVRKVAASSQFPGEHEYDAVVRLITNRPGNVWAEAEIQCRYNLVKLLGGAHLDFLDRFTSTFVDFTAITVPCSNIKSLATIHELAPWLKVCLYALNYISDACAQVSQGKNIADNWVPQTIIDMKRDIGTKELLAMEESTRELLNEYSERNLVGASEEIVHKARCRIALKIGEVLTGKFKSGGKRLPWQAEFAKIEDAARNKFPKSMLGPHVITREAASSQSLDAAACSQALPSGVDSMPAVAFDASGQAQEDAAAAARAMGLAVGSKCILTRVSRGVQRLRVGTILALVKKDASVRWWKDGEQPEEETPVPLAFLKLWAEKETRKTVDPGGEQPETEVELPPGLEWNCYSDSDLEGILQHTLLAFNKRLAIQKAPSHDEVSILEEPRILIAKKDIPPLALKILPTAADLKRCAKPKARSKAVVDWAVNVKSSADEAFFRREGVPPSLGIQVGTTLNVDFAAFLAASSQEAASYVGGCVHLESIESGQLEISVCPYATEDANLKSSKKIKMDGTMVLEARCRYWTNTTAIGKGVAIAAPA
jgi:hypothetical protein